MKIKLMDFVNVTQISYVTFNRKILGEWVHLRRKSGFCELIHATGLLDDLCTEPQDIALLIEACTNFRDEFLLHMLWESGMRIGEALALWLEDFEIDGRRIHIRDRGELSNLAEIKTVCSPRTLDVSADLMNMYLDYITEFHTDEVDTNHVFIKISGENMDYPLEYGDVASLFKRISGRGNVQN